MALKFIDSEKLESGDVGAALEGVDGILVPGGFGERGIEGKICSVQYAREHKIPFFGICLGMQMAVIEFARNVCGLKGANSTEFDEKTQYPVIDIMEEQKAVTTKGATMRLGAYPCTLEKGAKAHAAYGEREISERHRHRYEFNNTYMDHFRAKGMVFSGICPQGQLVEIIELANHPWFLGCQFHPEFKSRPFEPHPLFNKFIEAAAAYARKAEWVEQKEKAKIPENAAARIVKAEKR